MNQKNKNLIIIPSLKFGGGTEKLCSIIGSEFHEKGYDIQYFTFYDANYKYQYNGDEYSLSEKKSNYFGNIRKLFKRAFEIKKFCKKNNINKCISFVSDANFSTIISKFFGNKSKIYISVEYSINDYKKSLYHYLIKLLYKYADKIIVHTNYEYNNLIKNYKFDYKNIILIPNFIDINNIQKISLEPLDIHKKLFENQSFSFISIGRLKKVKNQQLMISTFKKLNEKYKNIQLIILGDGQEKENLKKIANDNVHFLGNQKNVFKFLSKSNCFILTSESESFSIAILEAMACNLPIISTKVQGPNEILDNGKYGILTEHNEKDIYEAMEKILLDKDLRTYYKTMSKKRIEDFQKDNTMKLRENIIND